MLEGIPRILQRRNSPSPSITSSPASQIQRRAIISCMTAHAARSPGRRPCRWRRRAKAAHFSRKFSKDNSHARASANKQFSAATNNSRPTAPREPPPYSKSTTVDNSARPSDENAKNSGRLRAVTCGKLGHVASAYNSNAKPARKCCACGGVGHMARDCPTRASQSKTQASPSTSNAVASAGRGASHVFTAAVIGGVRIADALVDTGSAFSMLSTAMYSRLPSAPAIQPFSGAAPDVIGVGAASAEILGYVDAPVELAGTAVYHPLLVVEGLAFSLLIGTDILRPHGAMLTLDESAPLRLRTRVCDVCREQRTNPPAESSSAPLTACAATRAVIEPCTAAFIRVRVPRA